MEVWKPCVTHPPEERALAMKLLTAGLCCLLACPGSSALAAEPASKAATIDFDRDVRPILSDNCYHCHGPDENHREADLRLDTRDGLFGNGKEPGAVVPGQPSQSELLSRVLSDDESVQMPPADSGRKLSAAQKSVLKRWIAEGAVWQGHWSFAPIRSPQLPALPTEFPRDWPTNPVDVFVARMTEHALLPSKPAEKTVWLRRVTFDLTGLPPTLAEVDEFLADRSPLAEARVLDRLFASPRYGEHMATAWLDAARYADSNGYQQEKTRTMWPWRDWVVQAYNRNQPFDEFTVEQLAGDLLPDATREQLVATGFNRNHMLNGEGGRIAEESRVDYVVDRVETTSTVWLGLTMGCARCHDHKYDPVSQNEFYRFFAYFNSIDERGNVDRGGNANPVLSLPTAEQSQQQAELNRQIAELDKQLAALKKSAALTKANDKSATDAETAAEVVAAEKARVVLQKQRDGLQKRLDGLRKSFVETMVMRDRSQPRETYRLIRGQWDKPDKSLKLQPDVPAALPALPKDAAGDRLSLAQWLVHPEHPLTARVAVNREWQRFFGRGLVNTPEDFGSQGERPTHPLLLDWLAADLIKSGWDIKRLQRLILSSATYRQSSAVTALHREQDPANRWLSRGPRFRLTAQMLRDQALAVSGLLVEREGGPPVKPYQPAGVWQEMTLGKIKYDPGHGDDLYRRSLYTYWRRSVGPTMLFDTPARQVCSVRVMRTNTPLHALTLLNETGFVEASRVFATRAQSLGGKTVEEQIHWMFRSVTARQPTPAETVTLSKVHQRLVAHFQAEPTAAAELLKVGEWPLNTSADPVQLASLTTVASMILNLDEAVTKE